MNSRVTWRIGDPSISAVNEHTFGSVGECNGTYPNLYSLRLELYHLLLSWFIAVTMLIHALQ